MSMRIGRASFVRRSLLLGGLAAVGVAGASPRSARAGTEQSQGASMTPCDYSLRKLTQDATGSALGVENQVQAPQGSKYRIKLSWTPSGGPVSAWLDFRADDSDNHYVLLFDPGQVAFDVVQNGVQTTVASAARGIDALHPALFTLNMDGYTLTLTDDAASGKPVILSWTDPGQVSMLGLVVSHNVGPGTKGSWDFSIGTALSPA